MATKRYKSYVLASAHEAATALAKAGFVDQPTMRAFDAKCRISNKWVTRRRKAKS
ncbi:MAG: hypothetical protein ABL864_14755 [Terricaulis sp.]